MQSKKAVGWPEFAIGRCMPINPDLGQDVLTQKELGQMDCIEEEENVAAFLHLFQNEG